MQTVHIPGVERFARLLGIRIGRKGVQMKRPQRRTPRPCVVVVSIMASPAGVTAAIDVAVVQLLEAVASAWPHGVRS